MGVCGIGGLFCDMDWIWHFKCIMCRLFWYLDMYMNEFTVLIVRLTVWVDLAFTV